MTYQEVKQLEHNIVYHANWSIDMVRDNKNCLYHFNPYLNQELLLTGLESELSSPFGNDLTKLTLYDLIVLQCLSILN